MIPLAVPNLTGRESKYLQQCIETTFVSSVGPFVTRFEKMVAEAAGGSMAAATSAGTTGLHAALVAVGVGQNDLVVLPSFTFIASANAIAYCGASPWLLDVTAESWTLDPALLAEQLATETHQKNDCLVHKATGRRVAAVMPVYTLGMPADMDAITKIANDYNLPVVADGAAALGATYKKYSSGSLGADLTVYSFNGNKIVTAGGGGAVVGEDPELMKLVCHLTTTAKVGEAYHHDRVGFNYRMTELQGAIGLVQLSKLDYILEKQRENKRKLKEAIDTSRFRFRNILNPEGDIAETLVIFLESAGQARKLVAGMKKQGLGTKNLPDAISWHFAAYWSHIFSEDGSSSVESLKSRWKQSTEWLERAVALPVMVNMEDSAIDKVAETMNRLCKEL